MWGTARRHHRMLAVCILAPLIFLFFPAPHAVRQFPPAARYPPDGRTAVYFGNGCFWERQWAYYNVELDFGRSPRNVTALVGYGGGDTSKSGAVCYHCGFFCAEAYDNLGNAEVVEVLLDSEQALGQVEVRTGPAESCGFSIHRCGLVTCAGDRT